MVLYYDWLLIIQLSEKRNLHTLYIIQYMRYKVSKKKEISTLTSVKKA